MIRERGPVMKNTFYSILILLVTLSFTACGASSPGSEKLPADTASSSAKEQTTAFAEEITAVPQKSSSELYDDALRKISKGETVEGIRMLAEIPAYKDAELYLEGYSYLEYFVGEWQADLKNPIETGITVYPYEMKFRISDAGLWFDNEVNGFQRLRFPVSIEYTIWKDNKTETGEKEYEGYLLFDSEKNNSHRILFGVPEGGLWYNMSIDSSDRSICRFSVSDDEGKIDTKANNDFYCDRMTERQSADITWDKHAEKTAEETREETKKGGSTSGSQGTDMGNSQALKKALSYLSVSAFSKQGLIEQLEYEGFSHSEAEAAAENCGADWNEQALKKAKSYLNVSAFSYSGLVEQLEYEGFTSAQAGYGVDNCGADWYEQAVEKAKSYLKYSSFSRTQLIEQLEYEGFTHAQAEYGVGEAY